jgi:hypothetical protein
MKKEHGKMDRISNAKPNETISVTIQVPKGILHFLLDHIKYLEETEGWSNAQEYFEEAMWQDFEAQVDRMHLKINEVCERYNIPQSPWGNSPGKPIVLPPGLVKQLRGVAATGGYPTVQEMIQNWDRSGLLTSTASKLLD